MAQKAKSIFLTIQKKGTLKNLFHKVFFNAKDYNDYVNTDEFKTAWPKEELSIVEETESMYWCPERKQYLNYVPWKTEPGSEDKEYWQRLIEEALEKNELGCGNQVLCIILLLYE